MKLRGNDLPSYHLNKSCLTNCNIITHDNNFAKCEGALFTKKLLKKPSPATRSSRMHEITVIMASEGPLPPSVAAEVLFLGALASGVF